MGTAEMNLKQNVKSVSYVLVSNLLSFLISALITFIVPKRLGVEGYGYFQLYLFYSNYTGFLHFGWADGIFLRYGGAYYESLDKRLFSGQFRLYAFVELVFGLLVVAFGTLFVSPQERKYVVILTGISIFLSLTRTFLLYILQCTNRIKEYSVMTMTERVVYIVAVTISLLMGTNTFVPIGCSDLLGKAAALGYGAFQCRALLTEKPVGLSSALKEARTNIAAGIKLMFASIASMLIIGFVRISIENQWSVATFGKVSLTMSVSNLLMVFIRAVALVMFPMLRRTDESRLSGIYSKMRTCLMIPLLGLLTIYYPAKIILSAWLPQYSDSLIYMALLFPMCVFESKMSMLIETYMKTLRKEKWLLIVNVTTVTVSVVVAGITVFWLHNLDLAIISIVALLAFRCVLAEILLSQAIDISVKSDIALELLLTIVFIASSWFVGGWKGLLLYLAFYVFYIVIKRKSILEIWKMIEKRLPR